MHEALLYFLSIQHTPNKSTRLTASEFCTYSCKQCSEGHTQGCGGTKETAPRLFSVRVRKRDGRLTSDAYDGVNYKPVDRALDRAGETR
jgi:hypothetical protein